ncbi:putative basic-leucine zipper transcription factor [Balamuthia mandrillaris]
MDFTSSAGSGASEAEQTLFEYFFNTDSFLNNAEAETTLEDLVCPTEFLPLSYHASEDGEAHLHHAPLLQHQEEKAAPFLLGVPLIKTEPLSPGGSSDCSESSDRSDSSEPSSPLPLAHFFSSSSEEESEGVADLLIGATRLDLATGLDPAVLSQLQAEEFVQKTLLGDVVANDSASHFISTATSSSPVVPSPTTLLTTPNPQPALLPNVFVKAEPQGDDVNVIARPLKRNREQQDTSLAIETHAHVQQQQRQMLLATASSTTSAEGVPNIGGGCLAGRPQQQCASLNPEDDRMAKRQRRLIKNRESAQKSRMRKKLYMEELEGKVQKLATHNQQLLEENKLLKEEVNYLKGIIKKTPGLAHELLQRSTRIGPAGATPNNVKAAGVCLLIVLFSFGLFFNAQDGRHGSLPHHLSFGGEGADSLLRDTLLMGQQSSNANRASIRSRLLNAVNHAADQQAYDTPVVAELSERRGQLPVVQHIDWATPESSAAATPAAEETANCYPPKLLVAKEEPKDEEEEEEEEGEGSLFRQEEVLDREETVRLTSSYEYAVVPASRLANSRMHIEDVMELEVQEEEDEAAESTQEEVAVALSSALSERRASLPLDVVSAAVTTPALFSSSSPFNISVVPSHYPITVKKERDQDGTSSQDLVKALARGLSLDKIFHKESFARDPHVSYILCSESKSIFPALIKTNSQEEEAMESIISLLIPTNTFNGSEDHLMTEEPALLELSCNVRHINIIAPSRPTTTTNSSISSI